MSGGLDFARSFPQWGEPLINENALVINASKDYGPFTIPSYPSLALLCFAFGSGLNIRIDFQPANGATGVFSNTTFSCWAQAESSFIVPMRADHIPLIRFTPFAVGTQLSAWVAPTTISWYRHWPEDNPGLLILNGQAVGAGATNTQQLESYWGRAFLHFDTPAASGPWNVLMEECDGGGTVTGRIFEQRGVNVLNEKIYIPPRAVQFSATNTGGAGSTYNVWIYAEQG